MAATQSSQMNKMFFTALYADRNNIPSDIKSKLLLSSLLPEDGMMSFLSAKISIDQYKDVLDQKKALEDELKNRQLKQVDAADRFLIDWFSNVIMNAPDRAKAIEASAYFLSRYIFEVHNIKLLPPSFSRLDDDVKNKIESFLLTLP